MDKEYSQLLRIAHNGNITCDLDVENYSVSITSPVFKAIDRLAETGNESLYCLNSKHQLVGKFSVGKLQNWLLSDNHFNLRTLLSEIVPNEASVVWDARAFPALKDAESVLRSNGGTVPLVDEFNRIVAVARLNIETLKIGAHSIGKANRTFIVAEIGINHNGDPHRAKRMVDEARKAGADCVKFQLRSLRTLYTNQGDPNDIKEDVGSQYILDVLSSSHLSKNEFCDVFDYCRKSGIEALCTPWDEPSVELLENLDVNAFKIASADLTNHDLIKRVSRSGKPLILSTGMSTEDEVKDTVDVVRRQNVPYALLHCISSYPAPHKDLNLKYIRRLKEIGSCPVGYSSHDRGILASVAAVACGAKIIEKHFTLDRNLPGNDHKISLLPMEFKALVDAVRETEPTLGQPRERKVSQGERMNREILAKSLVAAKEITKGQIIKNEMVVSKSPGKGLQPNKRKFLIGRTAKRNLKKGDCFFHSDLVDKVIQARNYKFERPWGIPVRYHDFGELASKSNMDFVEFHLSYKDLDVDVQSIVSANHELYFTLHAPDILKDDQVLDLASSNKKAIQASINALNRCIEIANELKGYLSYSHKPLVIVSSGGCTKDRPIEKTERRQLYERLMTNLAKINVSEVEVVFQTMPPYPWYFGGQYFANIFVDPYETAKFCEESNVRLCFDVSHTKLASNFINQPFKESVDSLAPITAHFHIVDATGINGEGLQIGDGEIEFESLGKQMNVLAPQASFIPEIWQGHKNGGEGFWIALERLEKLFSKTQPKDLII